MEIRTLACQLSNIMNQESFHREIHIAVGFMDRTELGSYTMYSTNGCKHVSLPAGAVVKSVRYIGVETLVSPGAVFDIGFGELDTAPSQLIISRGTHELANHMSNGFVVGASRNLEGTAECGAPVFVIGETNRYLNVSINTPIISGALCVEVEYYIS